MLASRAMQQSSKNQVQYSEIPAGLLLFLLWPVRKRSDFFLVWLLFQNELNEAAESLLCLFLLWPSEMPVLYAAISSYFFRIFPLCLDKFLVLSDLFSLYLLNQDSGLCEPVFSSLSMILCACEYVCACVRW